MAANGGAQFSDAFDRTFPSDAAGNNIFVGRDVLRGLVGGIDDFVECRQPRWRRYRSLGPTLLGSSFLLNDDDFLAALEKLAGACVVINKMKRTEYVTHMLRQLAALNRQAPGIPLEAFGRLRDLALLEEGRPAVVGPYGPAPGTGRLSTFRTLGFRETAGQRFPPLVHAKLALLGHLWWHDEDDGPGVADVVGFQPFRLWVSSANFTRGSRRSIEFGYWTEDPALLKAAEHLLVELIAGSEDVDPDADDWRPDMARIEYDHDAMVEAMAELMAEERYALLEQEAQAEDWLARRDLDEPEE